MFFKLADMTFIPMGSDAKQKKTRFFKIKTPPQKKRNFFFYFIIIYNLKAGKSFLILCSAYSSYIQVVKHYIQHVNCIFIDSDKLLNQLQYKSP